MDKTAKAIAKLTGFSTSTVSKVLNNRPGISAATKMKIHKAVEELKYFPHCKSRTSGLSQRMFKYIGVITSQYTNYIYSQVEEGIENILSNQGYHILKLIFNLEVNNLIDKELFFKKIMDDQSIAGLLSISVPLNDKIISELNQQDIPVVIVDEFTDFGKCVLVDNSLAIYEAIRKLISLGHKNIGFITPEPIGENIWAKRLAGYKKALSESNIAYNPQYIEFQNHFNMELVEIATQNLIKRVPELTALMFISDSMAIPGMKTIQKLGFKVPEDISVIGFDNIDFDNYLTPTLSSVKQPGYEMGKQAANMLLRAIKDKDFKHEVVYLKTEFIQRESVKSFVEK